MAENSKVLKAMVSSTARDLPNHRDEVMNACLREGTLPRMMEHLYSSDAESIKVSLDMVDESDMYIGVFAHRYGYIPKENNPGQISITEMEYNRAVECDIPRLIFLMHDDHPVKAADVDKGEEAVKLDELKRRLEKERVVSYFESPADLRAHVIGSLSQYKEKNAEEDAKNAITQTKPVSGFHYVSNIPQPPEVYVAHPYTLLQTHGLVGRQPELNLLTDWVSKPNTNIYNAHILSIVAIGGMGKSALTWKWFSDIAPEEMKPLAGRMWWSFYESDASFENFVVRAWAYISGQSIEEIRQMASPDREAELIAALNREPFLIVFDGLERILMAYARMDASRLNDAQVGSQKNVRKSADPRAGQFLRKLAQVNKSRILISTRLFPAELETDGGDTLPGVSRIELEGLTEDDALDLWRAFGVSGSRDLLQPIFDSIDKHPLLIQALAGEIKRYKKAPGNFEEWRKNNPAFDPTKFRRVQEAMAHVMEFALQELDEKPQKTLQIIAAFRMPMGYGTLTALLIGTESPFGSENELDEALVELEDRGLVGWDKRANRYDLHPIVRGVVWSGLAEDARQSVYTSLHTHFEAMPMIEDWGKVESLEDLTPAIELYNTLIGMGHYKHACDLFFQRLSKATLYRLSASRQRVEMLEMLFPDGLDELPRLSDKGDQAVTLSALAAGYRIGGQPGRAAVLGYRSKALHLEISNDNGNLCISLYNLAFMLRMTGRLRESEGAARQALKNARKRDDSFDEPYSLTILGLTQAARGEVYESERMLRYSLQMWIEQSYIGAEGLINAYLAQQAISLGNVADALTLANRAWDLAVSLRQERDFIRSARLQGEAALGLGDTKTADERLHHALTRARAVNYVEEELPILVGLAELRRQKGDEKAAREFLDDIWEFAERGPYPLFHADALNVLAQIERDAGNNDKAIEAATKAYQLAWCDGPPYAYHWGLIKAQKHLEELGAPLQEMPAFDESKFEPMPEVEIDPDDEFHVGESSAS